MHKIPGRRGKVYFAKIKTVHVKYTYEHLFPNSDEHIYLYAGSLFKRLLVPQISYTLTKALCPTFTAQLFKMMMGTGSMQTMAIPTATGTAMADSSSSMDMSSGDSMSMSMHFTSNYNGVPVLFASLSAATGGKAFGIFVFLFFTAFAFRGLSFLSTYIEHRVFSNESLDDVYNSVHVHINSTIKPIDETSSGDLKDGPATSPKSTIARFFDYSAVSIYRDFIRLLLTVVSVILGYALMLAVMSFVVLYFFAVVLGIAFGEIFFMRLSYALEMPPPDNICSSVLH